MMTYYTLYTYCMTITMNVCGICVVCLIVWLLLSGKLATSVALWWRITHPHILCMTMTCVISVVCLIVDCMITFALWWRVTYTYVFRVSMCMTLSVFVRLWYVWLLLSGKVTTTGSMMTYVLFLTTTPVLPWWFVTRTHKLCWFPGLSPYNIVALELLSVLGMFVYLFLSDPSPIIVYPCH